MRTFLAAVFLATAFAPQAIPAQPGRLPNQPDSVKFAVIGDNGTGDEAQYAVGEQMAARHRTFPFDLVIMLGDNFFGRQSASGLARNFERPYAPLLAAGVEFRAALGNHDPPEIVSYAPLNMNGARYYTYVRKNIRFFVLDSNFLDAKQLEWANAALADSRDEWKICYFHHALYSNAARHGSTVDVRVLLEPLLVRHGVHVVFSGHDHVYERLQPQKGIYYFVAGGAGRLRKGNLRPSPTTAAGFDREQSFMLVEIAGTDMFFETIARSGRTVDSGVIRRGPPRMSGTP